MMRTLLLHILLLGALLAGACSKDATDIPAAAGTTGETGALILRIAATRAEGEPDTGYDPMQHLTVRVYNAEGGLIRKYTSREELPERLELLAGTYRVAVELGESGKTATQGFASFDKRLYRGEQTFTVQAGATEQVEVLCKNIATAVEVRFDASVADNLGEEFSCWVAAAETFDAETAGAGKVPALRYTTSTTGYFDLLDTQTTLSWQFTSTHPERGPVVKTGSIADIRQPGKYRLEFAWSDDLPGFIECFVLKVDTSTDDKDDTIIFSPDPTIEGDDFDIAKVQNYESGQRRVRLTTMKPMCTAGLLIDGTTSYDLYGAAGLPEGVSIEQVSETVLVVTLSDAFFAALSAGNHTLAFSTSDSAGGKATVPATFRLEGLVPVSADDCDLWHNTLTLRAVTFDPDVEVSFTLRASDGTTQTLVGQTDADGYRSATFAPEWAASTNPKGHTVYSAVAGTGVRAGLDYDYSATLPGGTVQGSFSTRDALNEMPGWDMDDASLPCFTTNGSKSSATWGSGNNSNTSSLCTRGDLDGNGYALLQSTYYIAAPAAGNLFYGTFEMSGTTGKVGFGQKYVYKSRPAALHVRYNARIGTVDYNKAGGPLAVGEQDCGRIYAAIVDWSARHTVSSTFNIVGSSTCSGTWDPEDGPDAVGEGRILGYASLWIDGDTPGDDMIPSGDALKIYWYDHRAVAPEGNYTLVISVSANAYGDYFDGCSKNRMIIDDFEWVY